MLPGFRFLLAATLLTVSLLVFGLGAAALLRASHEQFASLPKQNAPPPAFTQTANAAPPTLSMLRVEPPPENRPVETLPSVIEPLATPESLVTSVRPQFDTLLPTDRIATLSIAPRVEEPVISPPVAIEPTSETKAEITLQSPKAELVTEPPVQIARPAPVIEPAPPIETMPIAAAPVVTATADAPTKVEADAPSPAPVPLQVSASPEPETTGTIAAPEIAAPEIAPPTPLVGSETPLVNARPIRTPPIPRDRPAAAGIVAALPDPAISVSVPVVETKKPVVRRRKSVAKPVARPKRRIVSRPAPPRPAAQNPASAFGASPFGT